MATAKKAKVDRKLVSALTPTFRVSYEHVWVAQAPKPTDKKKFSVTMLFPKSTDLTTIKEVIKQAKIAEFGPDKKNWPDDLQSPVSDGDSAANAEKEGYKGCWVIKATSNEDQRPSVVGPYPSTDAIINKADFYSGCYARASVFARYWEYMGKHGVQFILDGVQKMKDGKSLTGKKPAEELFAPPASHEDEPEVEEESF